MDKNRRRDIIEKIWGVYFALTICITSFGAGYHMLTGPEGFNIMPMKWVLVSLCFSLPFHVVFFLLLTVFEPKK